MKIDFYLRFYTHPGQSILVTGNLPEMGDDDSAAAIPLNYVNGEFWHVSLQLESAPNEPFHYHYILKNEDGTLTEEWGDDRMIEPAGDGIAEIQAIDTWNHAGEFENVFYTSPFRDVLLPRHKPAKPAKKTKSKAPVTHIIRVKAPLLAADEVVCLLGTGTALQDWDESEPLLLSPEGDWWTLHLHLPPESFPLEYKYGVYDKHEKSFLRYETGPNRSLPGDARREKLSVIHDGFVHLPNTGWKGAGVAIPVFSLRSKGSMGVGEFADIELLVDWAVKCGLRMIQLLPIQDTTANHSWTDSYPYAAISAFALHPIYLNLSQCAGKKYAELIKPLRKKQKEFNEQPTVDYEQVIKIKLLALKELYELQKEEFKANSEFQAFFQANESWLVPYAVFCYLRDKYSTPDFTQWKLHSRYDATAIWEYAKPGTRYYDSIALQYFIQYHLHLQLRKAVDYAHKQGVVLKGDIPIGIGRHSCDAWVEPTLYHMEMQAGAPPDNFAVKGQNWGFPTYNWEEMQKDGYAWWKRRFSHMRNYFDAFRIDHILGFFRIWSIPMDVVEGILGRFEPAIPVHRSEFQNRNIGFDADRYTQPFINDAVLWEMFGQESDSVKGQYLEPTGNGFYRLRDAFGTQRKIETSVADDKLRAGLFNLLSNVILLQVEGSPDQ
ncbi:MAG: 4-alpha-glucanotransferase, partial [Bacteroidetes bacterium]|nr:4-alpha-glucanotransferase [Bacteroidota bacterium]